ncbi:hypothetical protein BH11VER1_BH11VER1_03200 [soil metagenome]
MTWSEFLQVCRIRAIEESDTESRVWDKATVREVNTETGKASGRYPDRFLFHRASRLAARVKVASILPALEVREVPSWMGSAGWLVAFGLGWWLAALGQESEINLLALPLIGILVWNATMVFLTVLTGFKKTKPSKASLNLPAWFQGIGGRKTATLEPSLADVSLKRFLELTQTATTRRIAVRFRAWLHLAAAILAFGSVSGMYARGWSKEYRAVWESTLLDEAGASRFLGTLFLPAAKVTGVTIPLASLPDMHRRSGEPAAHPGPALPWIHLYAATLGLFVMVPRFLLVMLELRRASGIVAPLMEEADWQTYGERLRAGADGDGAAVEILTYGLSEHETSQDRWRLWARRQWQDMGRAVFHAIPVGDEAGFVKSWKPSATRVLVIFNLAGTPEVEVHRWLAEALAERKERTMMLLALDDTDLKNRWSAFADAEQRLKERDNSWRQMMRGLPVGFTEINQRVL